MEKFEGNYSGKTEKSKSIDEVFEERRKYIPEAGEQLSKKSRERIEINGGEIEIDYRVISIEGVENKDADPVVLLPGFGSGWEGVSELGFSLACEGRRVVMPSLPGYGNSENPSRKYYETDNFNNEAEAISQLIEKLEPNKKVHLVGHSMGSEILATLAKKYPGKVSSLTLLNPAGVEKKEKFHQISSKFLFSGMQTSAEYNARMVFSGEKDYEKELSRHVPKTKSPFGKGRLSQRMSETKRLLRGSLLEKIKDSKVPINFISGELDSVFPPGEKGDPESQIARVVEGVNNSENIEKSVMMGLRHNTTIVPDEITAANIEHYLEVAEEKNTNSQ